MLVLRKVLSHDFLLWNSPHSLSLSLSLSLLSADRQARSPPRSSRFLRWPHPQPLSEGKGSKSKWIDKFLRRVDFQIRPSFRSRSRTSLRSLRPKISYVASAARNKFSRLKLPQIIFKFPALAVAGPHPQPLS
jgi:hypothetical protein